MKTPSLLSLILLAAVVSLGGCSDSSPTAPSTAGGQQNGTTLHTTVTFKTVVVHNDGDLVGKGEFEFYFRVNKNSAFRSVTLGTGDAWDPGNIFYTVTGAGSEVKVGFEATEWDVNLLGKDVPDSDMDSRSGSRSFSVPSSPSPSPKEYSITLGNSDCKVQVYFELSTWNSEN